MAWTITRWQGGVNQSSIADYSALLARIQNNIKDDEVTQTDADEFIKQGHDMIVRDLLKTETGWEIPIQMLARGADTIPAGGLTLPPNFRKARAVTVNRILARWVSPEKVGIDQSQYDNAAVILDFYEWFEPPSITNPTNWLLEAASDVYLWASCLQYVPWGHEPEVLQLWRGFYADALTGLRETFNMRPRGGLSARKAYPYGAYYTIIGDKLFFSGPFRRDLVF